MSDFFGFLIDNWKVLVMGLLCIVELIIFLLKKRPEVNLEAHIKALIDDFAPSFILLAETTLDSGVDKLAFVVHSLLDKIKKYVMDKDVEYWKEYIICKVETILLTPQKKEGIKYEKK